MSHQFSSSLFGLLASLSQLFLLFFLLCTAFSSSSRKLQIVCAAEAGSLLGSGVSGGCEISGVNDSQVLGLFKKQLLGEGEPALHSWGSEDLSSWKGVTWGQNLSVVKLELSGVGLQGGIFPLLQGLPQLTVLNLSNNNFNGSLNITFCSKLLSELDLSSNLLTGTLPPVLPSFSNIRVLNMSFNKLSGGISSEIFGLQQLSILDLSNNSLTGNISIVSPASLDLQTLDLSCNNLSGGLPSEISLLQGLQVFNASHNQLTGDVPTSIGQLQRLEILDLGHNQLSGKLTMGLFYLRSLRVLNLVKNNISGALPEEIGQLSNLRVLDLCSNQLLGKLPSALGNCSQLVRLMLADNNLTGSIPLSFSSLSQLQILSVGNNFLSGKLDLNFSGFPVLEQIYLSHNFLSGSIPAELGYLQSLKFLSLDKNRFDGPIPGSLGNCSQLMELWLDHNNLTGSIPEEIFSLSNLIRLVLPENHLSGAISESISNLTNLVVLWLEENAFTGPIPGGLGSLKSLVMLSLASNNLEGTIPASIGRLQGLIGLDLGTNNLTGSIPDMLAGLSSIQFLFLPHNRFGGQIPSWIGNYLHLRAIDLSYNLFSGALPSEWGNLTALKVKGRYPDSEPSALVYTSEGLIYISSSALPTTIDFSYNHLNGGIPDGLGELQNLQALDLSMNSFGGQIPRSLGNASGLEKLDLSNNSLTGPIPVELTKLTFLAILNLSFNSLAGEIPYSGQLCTFGKMSFIGNAQLCGLPLEYCNQSDSPSAIFSRNQDQPKNVILKLLPLYIIIAGSIAFCIFWGFFFALLRRGRKLHCSQSSSKKQCSHSFSVFSGLYPISLNPKELALATDNYSQANVVGDGGFGMVYRAVLGDGSWVAVKKLITDGTQGEREFLAEMQTLGKVRHKNLVPLLGYSADGNDRILVYKYLKNGSLDTWLYYREDGMKPLDWPTRLTILYGAAQGICFLHYGCSPPIIHRDIKASNILLDECFEAHVADFGLARLMPGDSHVSTDVAGTVGYIPPEYNHTCIATTRGDVFSFGVVMLEILTAKRPTDSFLKKFGMGHLSAWIQSLSSLERISLAIDSSLSGACPTADVLELMRIACCCCQEIPGKRPNMKQVIQMIESVVSHPFTIQSPATEYGLKNADNEI